MLRSSRPPPPPPQRVRSIQVEEEHEERVVPPSTLPLPREERSSGEVCHVTTQLHVTLLRLCIT